jgi:hypothetical protein
MKRKTGLQHTFYYFYMQQIRKDFVDKLNVSCVNELNFDSKIEYSGFIKLDRQVKHLEENLLIYRYIVESWFNQKPVTRVVEKTKLQRLLASEEFCTFQLTVNSKKRFFDFSTLIYVSCYMGRKEQKNIYSALCLDKKKNTLFLKQIRFLNAPWICNFRGVNPNKDLHSKIFLNCNALFCSLLLPRLQLISFSNSKNLLPCKHQKLPSYLESTKILKLKQNEDKNTAKH